jgi:hypothetical protein
MQDEGGRKDDWWRRKRWSIPGTLLVLLVIVDLIVAFVFTSDKDVRNGLLGLMTPVVALIAGAAALLNYQETRRQNNRTFENPGPRWPRWSIRRHDPPPAASLDVDSVAPERDLPEGQ